jgi:hypothetical protein
MTLSADHRRLIEESAISPEVAEERGYCTARRKDELKALGFADYQCRLPALVVPIHNVAGEIVLYQARPDRPRRRNGKAIKYETIADARTAIDVPPASLEALADPSVELWITEGVRKADAAVSAGLCCVGLLGVWNWRGRNRFGGKTALADWECIALNERQVRIAFDSDVMQKAEVAKALARLENLLESRGARVRRVILPSGPDDAKVGLDDFLAAHGREALLELAKHDRPGQNITTKLADLDALTSQPGRRSQKGVLLDLVERENVVLFHDAEGRSYIQFSVSGHVETYDLGSKAVRRWLAGLMYRAEKTAPNAEALACARLVLEARAQFEGQECETFVRVGHADGVICLDLGNPAWQVIQIDTNGWRVRQASDVPVRFRRPAGMLALPEPMPGGELEELKALLNVATNSDMMLMIGWLVAALRGRGPYPVLALYGEQGSAKSTAARLLRNLIDPNRAPLRAEPRDVRDIMIAARNGWVVALDKVSDLRPWLSDALCRLATGGGFGTRELYSDSDETLFDAQRPTLINGIAEVAVRGDLLDRCITVTLIAEVAVRGDLLDRCITVTLPTIPDGRRLTEAELNVRYADARPRLLGALLDAVAVALRREAGVRLKRLPRMADAARWVVAAEPTLPWQPGEFLAAYDAVRETATETAIEASDVALAVREFVAERGNWEGTAGDLLELLAERVGERVARSRAWPRSPQGLSGELRRVAPALRAVGVGIDHYHRTPDRARRRVFVLSQIEAGQGRPHRPHRPIDGDGEGLRPDGPSDRLSDSRPHASARDLCRSDTTDDADGCAGAFLDEAEVGEL